MIPVSLADLAEVTGGQLHAPGERIVTGSVVVDSREVEPGGLFVALPGEHVDGHDFAAAAVKAGAAAVLGSRVLHDGGRPLPMILVEDPQLALGALARLVRSRLTDLTVIGVTGSSGKTSTKDLLAQLLTELGPTVAPQNSFNNEIGVPLTLLRCTADTRFLVSEMGARHPGNITYLCQLVGPDLGVVLNVGAAHLGEFGSRDVTAATKGELVAALPAAGAAILNADDPLVSVMAADTVAQVIRFGVAEAADLHATRIRLDSTARASFDLIEGETEFGPRVRLQLHGEHHISNALAAAAVVRHLGMELAQIADALSRAQAISGGRMSVTTRADGVVIIDDAYNANPDSMRAALAALHAMSGAGRAWAVLGEMRELGPDARREHARLGAEAMQDGAHRVLAVGPAAAAYLDDLDPAVVVPASSLHAAPQAGPRACHVADDVSAEVVLRAGVRPGDVVLFKASHAVGLNRLAARLGDSNPAATGTEGLREHRYGELDQPVEGDVVTAVHQKHVEPNGSSEEVTA